jgi:chromosome segregation ATPase
MSGEEFKQKFEEFYQSISQKMELSNEIKAEYDHLNEILSKLNLLSDEDFEEIQTDIESKMKQIDDLKVENDQFKKKIEDHQDNKQNSENIKIKHKMEKEGLIEKIKILQNSLDDYSSKANDRDQIILKQEAIISELKNDCTNYKNKYLQLQDEMEINNKNIKKNFSLEKRIQDLTEENEDLAKKIKNLENSEDLKLKCQTLENNLQELNKRYELLNNSFLELKMENAKLLKDNIEKSEKINTMSHENKIKQHKFEEIENEIKSLKQEINSLNLKLKDKENAIKVKDSFHATNTTTLKKEIDKLVKTNENLKKENLENTEKLKNYQHYTNFAKTNKEILSKKDFSILETMSRRVEELYVLY